MATTAELLQELEQEAQTTRRVLERVPDDSLDWRPHARSLSMGQLAMHVASVPGAIADLATRPGFDIDTVIPRPSATNSAELLATLDRSLDGARAVLGAMPDTALGEPWRMMRGGREVGSMPRIALLRAVMLNHWYHHRGQLTVYLRQVGASVPPIYGDSADERALPI